MDILQNVKNRFDTVAAGYNKKIEIAKCFGHEEMLKAFSGYNGNNLKNERLEMLDLGCGTGLCGQIFKPHINQIDGVDLSENMLSQAKELGIYRNLYLGDILTYLAKTKNKYDLITSSSVLMYFKELQPFLNFSLLALKQNGVLTFSCDRHDDNNIDVKINPRNNLMFSYSESYVERCIDLAGFKLINLKKIIERLTWRDLEPVPGFVILVRK